MKTLLIWHLGHAFINNKDENSANKNVNHVVTQCMCLRKESFLFLNTEWTPPIVYFHRCACVLKLDVAL